MLLFLGRFLLSGPLLFHLIHMHFLEVEIDEATDLLFRVLFVDGQPELFLPLIIPVIPVGEQRVLLFVPCA